MQICPECCPQGIDRTRSQAVYICQHDKVTVRDLPAGMTREETMLARDTFRKDISPTRLPPEREAEIRRLAATAGQFYSPPCFTKSDAADLLAEIDALREERDELKRDVTHAVKEAKRREPDYPWELDTASECVLALGEGLAGTRAACGDWHKRCEKLEAALDFYMRVCGNTGYAVSRESAREMYEFAEAARVIEPLSSSHH